MRLCVVLFWKSSFSQVVLCLMVLNWLERSWSMTPLYLCSLVNKTNPLQVPHGPRIGFDDWRAVHEQHPHTNLHARLVKSNSNSNSNRLFRYFISLRGIRDYTIKGYERHKCLVRRPKPLRKCTRMGMENRRIVQSRLKIIYVLHQNWDFGNGTSSITPTSLRLRSVCNIAWPNACQG